nr:hypothetical protein HeiferVagina-S102_00027 [Bovine alphaherpesvirus 1]WHT50231.1 hypothetical protein Milk-S104_00027 [Bovine alphaherpesvirus 1]WHT50319.1 hypothetical protein Docile-S101_00027 [Bovine alphaherpesvirus 1]
MRPWASRVDLHTRDLLADAEARIREPPAPPEPPVDLGLDTADSSSDWSEPETETEAEETGAREGRGPGRDSRGARVVPANSLLGRQYLRGTGISVLALLLEACEKIARRLRATRDVLRQSAAGVTADIFALRMLLG